MLDGSLKDFMSKFSHTKEVEMKIPTDQYTSMQDFSALLYRLKSLYTFTYEDSRLVEEEEQYLKDTLLNQQTVNQLDQSFVNEFKDELEYVNFNSRRFQYFSTDLGENDIYIKEIEDGSFLLTLSGTALAMVLVLALFVFITGGSMSISVSKLELEAGKTLGEGLKDLKEFMKK
jgi:hypothetical protein